MKVKSIRLKLTFWYIGTLSLLLMLFGLMVYFSLKTILIGNLDTQLLNGGKILEHSISEYRLENKNDPRSLYIVEKGKKTFLVDIIDDEVDEIFFVETAYAQLLEFPDVGAKTHTFLTATSSLKGQRLPLSSRAVAAVERGASLTETVLRPFPFPIRVISLPVSDSAGNRYVLQLALSTRHINSTLKELLSVSGALFPVVLILVAVVGHVFMKQAFSPIRRMVSVTREITSEDLSLRLDPIESRDEVGELADTLNAMIDRLEQSFLKITQFSGDVSHELKTPLSQLRCNAEIALRKTRSPEEYRLVLQNVIEDADQLQKIIEDLLFLATMEMDHYSSSFHPVALHEVLLETLESMRGLASEKGQTLRFEDMATATVTGDEDLLKRMITNLTANAVKYTPEGGTITFSLVHETGSFVLTVSDTGIGIPPEEVPFIFDRLYRVDPSRSHDTGGSGLGLSIVRNIVDLHRGTITVESSHGKGTTFTISFPDQALV